MSATASTRVTRSAALRMASDAPPSAPPTTATRPLPSTSAGAGSGSNKPSSSTPSSIPVLSQKAKNAKASDNAPKTRESENAAAQGAAPGSSGIPGGTPPTTTIADDSRRSPSPAETVPLPQRPTSPIVAGPTNEFTPPKGTEPLAGQSAQDEANRAQLRDAYTLLNDRAAIAIEQLQGIVTRFGDMRASMREEMDAQAAQMDNLVEQTRRSLFDQTNAASSLVLEAIDSLDNPDEWNQYRAREQQELERRRSANATTPSVTFQTPLNTAWTKGKQPVHRPIIPIHGKSSTVRLREAMSRHHGPSDLPDATTPSSRDPPPHLPPTGYQHREAYGNGPGERSSSEGAMGGTGGAGGGSGGGGGGGGGPPGWPLCDPSDDESSEDEEKGDEDEEQGAPQSHPQPTPHHPGVSNRHPASIFASSISGVAQKRSLATQSVVDAYSAPGYASSYSTNAPRDQKFEDWIRNHLRVTVGRTLPKDTPPNKQKPALPTAYAGSDNIDTFTAWFLDHTRWNRLSHLCGPAMDNERLMYLGTNVTGRAAEWYRDTIELDIANWTHAEAICTMYQRFIRPSTKREAARKFDNVHYTVTGGAFGLYHDMIKWAKRMPVQPDDYTMARTFCSKLPDATRETITTVYRVTPEDNPDITLIRDLAADVEDGRAYISRSQSANTTTITPRSTPSSAINGSGRPRPHPDANRRTQDRTERTPSAPRPTNRGERTHQDAKTPTLATASGTRKTERPPVTCWNCKQVGHYATDAMCPANKKPALRRLDAVTSELPVEESQEGEDMANEDIHEVNAIRHEEPVDTVDVVGPQYETHSDVESEYNYFEDAQDGDDYYETEPVERMYGMSIAEFYHREPAGEESEDDESLHSDGSDGPPSLIDVDYPSDTEYHPVTNLEGEDVRLRDGFIRPGVPFVSSDNFSRLSQELPRAEFDAGALHRIRSLEDRVDHLIIRVAAIQRLHGRPEAHLRPNAIADELGRSTRPETSHATTARTSHQYVAPSLLPNDPGSVMLRELGQGIDNLNQSVAFQVASVVLLQRELGLLDRLARLPVPSSTIRQFTERGLLRVVQRMREEEEHYAAQRGLLDVDPNDERRRTRERAAFYRQVGHIADDEETVARMTDEQRERDAEEARTERVFSMIAKHDRGYRTSLNASTSSRERPAGRGRCMTFYISFGEYDALVLVDTGSTVDAVSHDFAKVAKLKTYPLSNPITLQLGCSGSRSKVNYGLSSTFSLGDETHDLYFDVANIDHYDVILGIPFLDRVGMVLDFRNYTMRIGSKTFNALQRNQKSITQVKAKSSRPPAAPAKKLADESSPAGPSN